MGSDRTEKIISQFERVVNRYIATEKRPHDYNGRILYRSEVHTIDAIGHHPGINVTELAANQGVTKGAVSQMIDKLVKKELVVKTVLSKSDTEVALNLTEAGSMVFSMHKEYHREMYRFLEGALSAISDEDLVIYLDIFSKLERFLAKM